MIANLTEAEWDALLEAVSMYDTHLEQDAYPEERPMQRRQALNRALDKARQLAPMGKGGRKAGG